MPSSHRRSGTAARLGVGALGSPVPSILFDLSETRGLDLGALGFENVKERAGTDRPLPRLSLMADLSEPLDVDLYVSPDTVGLDTGHGKAPIMALGAHHHPTAGRVVVRGTRGR
jgi:hypothetical protein